MIRVIGTCTLLGPEGPDVVEKSAVTTTQGLFLLRQCGNGERYRPYFENYTVDASILEMILRDHFTNKN